MTIDVCDAQRVPAFLREEQPVRGRPVRVPSEVAPAEQDQVLDELLTRLQVERWGEAGLQNVLILNIELLAGTVAHEEDE